MWIWEAEYKGNVIEINSRILRKQLLINDELQDERSGLSFSAGLLGRIVHGEGKGEPVMANVRSLWPVTCEVTINGVSVSVSRRNAKK